MIRGLPVENGERGAQVKDTIIKYCTIFPEGTINIFYIAYSVIGVLFIIKYRRDQSQIIKTKKTKKMPSTPLLIAAIILLLFSLSANIFQYLNINKNKTKEFSKAPTLDQLNLPEEENITPIDSNKKWNEYDNLPIIEDDGHVDSFKK